MQSSLHRFQVTELQKVAMQLLCETHNNKVAAHVTTYVQTLGYINIRCIPFFQLVKHSCAYTRSGRETDRYLLGMSN